MFLWGVRRSKLIGVGGVALALLVAGLVSLRYFGTDPQPPARTVSGPRLAVLVVFDQMRADYLTRWDGLFDEGGFRRLKKEGAWFENCHFPYAETLTAPGHASLATGCSPRKHGIIGNTWYDRFLSKEVYCVYTDRYELVPLIRGEALETVGKWPGAWPGLLEADTLGDALKAATQNKGRVVSLSLKDRSAILLGCRQSPADACYWFFPPQGMFVTSTYYRPDNQPHPWVAEFNDGRPADKWFGKDWTRLRPDLDYVRYSGPDDIDAEDTGWDQGRTFPHAMTGGLDEPGTSYYEAIGNSPYGNELLLQLAERAITAENLGRKDVPDLLCLSFSSNDTIGHCWGPDSQEVLDTTLRSDRIVKELLDYLDTHVGRGRYALAVTADHGVCPLPEVVRGSGKDAGRIPPQLLQEKVEAFLNDTFGPLRQKGNWIEAHSDLWLYLNQRMLRLNDLEQARVEETLADWLRRQPGILNAYTRSRLNQGPLEEPIGERVRRSFHRERSGDVAVVLKPYHLLSSQRATGTTHGSPHPYDTHVPLLLYGPGIRGGARKEAVPPQAVVAILARSLNIDPPGSTEAPVPASLEGVERR